MRIWERAGRLLFQEAVIVVICAVIGVAALKAAYLIPRDDMRENVRKSSEILYNEGLGACIWEGIGEKCRRGCSGMQY